MHEVQSLVRMRKPYQVLSSAPRLLHPPWSACSLHASVLARLTSARSRTALPLRLQLAT